MLLISCAKKYNTIMKKTTGLVLTASEELGLEIDA
jgi:hypothetical protein